MRNIFNLIIFYNWLMKRLEWLKIRWAYLYKFMRDESEFIQGVSFFGGLLAILSFIPLPKDNLQLHQIVTLIRGGSFVLLILCLYLIIWKLNDSTAKSIILFRTTLSILLVAISLYVWYQYKGLILSAGFLMTFFIGIYWIEFLFESYTLSMQPKLNLKEIIFFLTFFGLSINVVLWNLSMIVKGQWGTIFMDVSNLKAINIEIVLNNLTAYFFMGYPIGIIILITKILKKDKKIIKMLSIK